MFEKHPNKIFEKYPNFELSADNLDNSYHIQYTEVIEDHGRFSFCRKKKILSRKEVEPILSKLLELMHD